jgi:cyclophilin family peptidyl-prolyl cis-trans isomerase/HEAT repeat protein
LRAVREDKGIPWMALYALQRIGNHPLIREHLEEITSAHRSDDPLVRMYLATLLGKVQDPHLGLPILVNLAGNDPDWRVRVNALTSLGAIGFLHHPASLQTVLGALSSDSPTIVLSAIRAMAASDLHAADSTTRVQEAFERLESIAKNQNLPWQLQGEATMALADLRGPSALPLLMLREEMPSRLKAELLEAAGKTGSPSALPMLQVMSGAEDPLVACGALAGVLSLIQRIPEETTLVRIARAIAVQALGSRDVAVIASAANLLGKGVLLDRSTTAPLLASLSSLAIPEDIEAYQEICSTLGKIGDKAAIPALRGLLEIRHPAVALSAARALEVLTGTAQHGGLPRRTAPLYTDMDFRTLESLPDTIPVTLRTSRGTIQLAFFKNAAPFTILAFARLVEHRDFFRGLTFHRVVPNFVIQGGDPRGDGWGGPGFTLRSEFSMLPFETGTVGIASAGKDTEGSQFFITQSPQPHLDGRYTVVGRVVRGQEVVDRIQVGDRIEDLTFGKPR